MVPVSTYPLVFPRFNPSLFRSGTSFSKSTGLARCGDLGAFPWSGPTRSVVGPQDETRLLEMQFDWQTTHLCSRRAPAEALPAGSSTLVSLGRSSVKSQYYILLLARHSSSPNIVVLQKFKISFSCTILSHLVTQIDKYLDRLVYSRLLLNLYGSMPLPSVSEIMALPQFEEVLVTGFGVWDDARLLAAAPRPPSIVASTSNRFSLTRICQAVIRYLEGKINF